jgi:hypothetical protein
MSRLSKYKKSLLENAEKEALRGNKQAQCILHLIDLKRAGHSPTRTELKIETSHAQFVPKFDPRAIYYVSNSSYD